MEDFQLKHTIENVLKGLMHRGLGRDDVPLLGFSVLDWINSYDWSEYQYIEFGSGSSTNYMADRFKVVNTIETDSYYFYKTLYRKKNNVNCYIYTTDDLELGRYEISITDKTIVMIDSQNNRFLTTKTMLEKGTPNIVLLDNSEWYPNTCKMLYEKGYSEIPFWGIRPEEDHDKCTSVFIRTGYTLPEKKYNFLSESGRFKPDFPLDGNTLYSEIISKYV
jgi:hypothetical protein